MHHNIPQSLILSIIRISLIYNPKPCQFLATSSSRSKRLSDSCVTKVTFQGSVLTCWPSMLRYCVRVIRPSAQYLRHVGRCLFILYGSEVHTQTSWWVRSLQQPIVDGTANHSFAICHSNTRGDSHGTDLDSASFLAMVTYVMPGPHS